MCGMWSLSESVRVPVPVSDLVPVPNTLPAPVPYMEFGFAGNGATDGGAACAGLGAGVGGSPMKYTVRCEFCKAVCSRMQAKDNTGEEQGGAGRPTRWVH
jgi:hypothetical protein